MPLFPREENYKDEFSGSDAATRSLSAISLETSFVEAVYGKDRAVRMDENHRMLRAIEGNDALREYFELGVNFIESLVNRHRIELYILDAAGRIAVSFERLHWDEPQIVTRAVETLEGMR